VKPNEASIPEGGEPGVALDKSFGFSTHFSAKYELGREVGRGHFGYTCAATAKKGELKGQEVAVKVIPKAKVPFSTLLHCLGFEYSFHSCLGKGDLNLLLHCLDYILVNISSSATIMS
jgi:serine/threonine protein kinase